MGGGQNNLMQILNFLSGLFAAVLASMGVGGGGLLVIYLVLVLGTEQIRAQGINLIFFLCASIFSLPFHIKAKRVDVKTVALFAPAGALGAYFGCRLGLSADPVYLRTAFGVLIIFAGSLTLLRELVPTVMSMRKKVLKTLKNE